MLNITDNAKEQTIPPILRLGFRPLFLSAGIFSALAILAWVLVLTNTINLSPFVHTMWWHGHEMIFGFSTAVIVGFLLTAVTNWTGQPGVKGTPLLILWLVWLTARVLLFCNFDWIADYVVIAVDLAFLPLAAAMLAIPVFRVKQYRNMFFVPVLLLLTVCNLITYTQPYTLHHGGYAALLFITLIMVVMGGRVIPFFTANATNLPRRNKIAVLEWVSFGSVFLLALAFVFNLHANSAYYFEIASLCLLAGVSNLIRVGMWRFTSTLTIPLLWSLQLSYFFIPLTLLLLSVHFFTGQFNLSTVLHGLTIGAVGNMIIAMMARVSLGHTGRPLVLSKIVPFAFMLVILSAFARLLGLFIDGAGYNHSAILSGAFWVMGFAIFTVIYWPVLTSPRADGRPG